MIAWGWHIGTAPTGAEINSWCELLFVFYGNFGFENGIVVVTISMVDLGVENRLHTLISLYILFKSTITYSSVDEWLGAMLSTAAEPSSNPAVSKFLMSEKMIKWWMV